jgi:hypothetical protein
LSIRLQGHTVQRRSSLKIQNLRGAFYKQRVFADKQAVRNFVTKSALQREQGVAVGAQHIIAHLRPERFELDLLVAMIVPLLVEPTIEEVVALVATVSLALAFALKVRLVLPEVEGEG